MALIIDMVEECMAAEVDGVVAHMVTSMVDTEGAVVMEDMEVEVIMVEVV